MAAGSSFPGLDRWTRPLRRLRGTVLLVLALPLAPTLLVNLLAGDKTKLLGTLLGIGLLALSLRGLRKGRILPAAILVGLATGLLAHLAASVPLLGAVVFGAMAFFGARLFYADAPPPEPVEPPAPPAPDPLAVPRARLGSIAVVDDRLRPAVAALGELLAELDRRPTALPDARRFLNLQLDGLERIGASLRVGAEPPATLPVLIEDMARGSDAMRDKLRMAEDEALEIQVKVLAERLRQEGYA